MVQELEVAFALNAGMWHRASRETQGDWFLSNAITSSCVWRRDSDLRLCISLYFICA